MEIIEIPVSNIRCDIEGRVNDDCGELIKLLRLHGQLEPLTVEGPDTNGYYYLIHGYRRYQAMKQMADEFAFANCQIFRPLTTQRERNEKRFQMVVVAKRATNAEDQFLFEATDNQALLKPLSPAKRKRIEKGLQIPNEERIKAAKLRLSQEALLVINSIPCPQQYRKKLKERYFDGKITGEHATAIKRLASNRFYDHLGAKLKGPAIDEAVRLAKFDDEDASLIILREIMSSKPHPDLANNWAEHVCIQIEDIIFTLHPDLKRMLNKFSKKRLQSVKSRLNELIDWITTEQNQSATTDMKKPRRPAREPRMERHGNVLRFLFEQADQVY